MHNIKWYIHSHPTSWHADAGQVGRAVDGSVPGDGLSNKPPTNCTIQGTEDGLSYVEHSKTFKDTIKCIFFIPFHQPATIVTSQQRI